MQENPFLKTVPNPFLLLSQDTPPEAPKAPENPFLKTRATDIFLQKQKEEGPPLPENPHSRSLTQAFKKTGSLALDTLAFLDRPRAATVATVGTLTGQMEPSRITAALKGDEHPSWGELLPEINVPTRSDIGGVLGVSGPQLRGAPPEPHTPGEKTNIAPHLGFLGDLFLDPLNLLSLGVATPAGKKAKNLTNVLAAHGDDLAKASGLAPHALSKALSEGSRELYQVLQQKGVSDKILSTLSGASDLAPDLLSKAQQGQWALAKYGTLHTPQAVNEAAATAISGLKKTFYRTTAGKVSNLSGHELFDTAAQTLKNESLSRKGDTFDNLAYFRDKMNALPEQSLQEIRNGNFLHNLEKRIPQTTPELQRYQEELVSWIQSRTKALEAEGLLPRKITETEYFPHVHGEHNQALLEEVPEILSRKNPLAPVSEISPVAPSKLPPGDALITGEILNRGEEMPTLLSRIFGSAPDPKTPHALAREIKWIKDPQTGKEVIDLVPRYAAAKKIPEVGLETRQASIKEINEYLGKDLFTQDPIQALTVASLNNEKAIMGKKLLDWSLNETAEEVYKASGQLPTLRDGKAVSEMFPSSAAIPAHPQPGTKVFIPGRKGSRFGEVHSLQGDMVKVAFKNDHGYDFVTVPAHQALRKEAIESVARKQEWVRPRLALPEGLPPETREVLDLLYLPKEKATVVENLWKMNVAPKEAMNSFSRLSKSYLSLWKRYSLFPFAEWHVRNVVGDLWNGWLHGWKPTDMVSDLLTAKQLQKGLDTSIATALYGPQKGGDLLTAARQHHVIGSGIYGEVVSEGLKPVSKLTALAKKHLVDLDIPMKIGTYMEDNRRLGLFLRRLKEGDSYEEAAKVVTKALFDYSDLTPFEKGIRDTLVPFYGWFRKNLPYQAEKLLREPRKFAVIPKTKGYLEGKSDSRVPEELIPGWMKKGYPISVGRADDGRENFLLPQNWIPSIDIFSPPQGLSQVTTSLWSKLNPLLKVPMEQLANQDAYFGGPIDKLEDTTDPLRFFRGNQQTQFLGQHMDTRTRKWLELLPFSRILTTADRLNPLGVFDEYTPTPTGKTRPYHTEMGTAEKLTKFLTGLKIYPVDALREAEYGLLGMRRGQSAPGLNVSNLKRETKKAGMEGDIQGVQIYSDKLRELQNQILDIQRSPQSRWNISQQTRKLQGGMPDFAGGDLLSLQTRYRQALDNNNPEEAAQLQQQIQALQEDILRYLSTIREYQNHRKSR